MRKIIIALICTTSFLMSSAQNTSVEKSIYGIQTGLLGVWAHNELKLTNAIALRSEIGFDAGAFSESFNEDTEFLFVLIPALTIEPRWYYNLNKRESKSYRTDGNSGNFIAIKTTYHIDMVIGSVPNHLNFISDISIVPTWGIRRNLGQHFNYEAGLGIGYGHLFEEENVYVKNTN
ncbi:hypothetical protein HNV08_06535 [Winogradskyella eckloniae]|uniref:hypothetical protein n=1 Tax=Winogradskyella eckloniae TaxID=1089306 RepID=UPI0015670523|nr:hypothetical protein [Winogradskyella eckloniae]NRD19699.1 hypothetical protein [Winogradskyella eckloniae]